MTTTPTTGESKRPTVPLSRRAWWIIGVSGAALLSLGVLIVVAMLPRFLTTPDPETTGEQATRSTEERRIQATLFYTSPDGEALVPVNRSVPYGATPSEQARRILEAQLQTPTDGAVPAVPAGVGVRHVFLTPTGEAYVDFGPEIAKTHPGGSHSEALTVYAIVNALTTNLPDVTSVQILIEGKEVDTLVGHIDLRQPLKKSAKWIRR